MHRTPPSPSTDGVLSAPNDGIRIAEVMTASVDIAAHAQRLSPVRVAVAGADRQYLVFSMERSDVVFAERGSFHSATVAPVLRASVVGRRIPEWMERLPGVIRWLATLVTAPLRLAGGAIGRTAAGESVFMLTVQATQSGTAIFVNHSGGQIQRIPLIPGEELMTRRGAWVAHTGEIRIGAGTMRAPIAALTSGAPFWYERMTGDGDVFIAAGGHIVCTEIREEQEIVVHPAHLVAWLGTPEFGTTLVGSLGGAIWGKEGVVLLTIRGPSFIYLDSAPRIPRGTLATPDTRYTGRAE